MAAFGVPVTWTPVVAWLVPLAELTCAVALGSAGWAWLGAIGASALLIALMAAIAVNIALGRKPDCHCFGQLHSSPAGWPTLFRNAALAGLATYVVAQGAGHTGPGLIAVWRASGYSSRVPAWVVALVVAWVIAGVWLYRSLPREERGATLDDTRAVPNPPEPPAPQELSAWAGSELPVGAPAPTFELHGLQGGTVTLCALQERGKPIVLLFTQPHCPACDGVLPDVGRWQREHGQRLVIVPISLYTENVDVIRAKANTHDLQEVLHQRDGAVGDAYGVDQLPSAVLVQDGRVASRPAPGRDAIRALVERATEPLSGLDA